MLKDRHLNRRQQQADFDVRPDEDQTVEMAEPPLDSPALELAPMNWKGRKAMERRAKAKVLTEKQLLEKAQVWRTHYPDLAKKTDEMSSLRAKYNSYAAAAVQNRPWRGEWRCDDAEADTRKEEEV